MSWVPSRGLAWFLASTGALGLLLSLTNLVLNTATVAAWLPLLIMMPLPLSQGIRGLKAAQGPKTRR